MERDSGRHVGLQKPVLLEPALERGSTLVDLGLHEHGPLAKGERAAKLFAGRHDFSSFCENAAGQTSTTVVVEKSEMLEWEREIHFRIAASHFLWKMVRRVVGTLVEVGRGNIDAAGVATLLERKSGEPAKWTAPPSGLFLEKVIYPG